MAALAYSLEIRLGDEFTWRVTIVDKDAWRLNFNESFESKFGGVASQLGAQKKIVVYAMGENTRERYITVYYKEWAWIRENDAFGEEPDWLKSERMSFDPKKYEWSNLFCPVPVAEYLNASFSSGGAFNVSGTTISRAEGKLVELKTYDAFSGALSMHQWKVNDQVVYEHSSFKTVSGYPALVVLAIAIVGTLGLVYLTRRRLAKSASH